MKKNLNKLIISCIASLLISCNTDTTEEYILEFSSTHDFSVLNNMDQGVVITSFLKDDQFNFSPNPQTVTVNANEQKRLINLGFIGDMSLDPNELFDSMKIEKMNGGFTLLTNNPDTLNWEKEVSAFVDANKVTYENILTLN